LDGVQLNDLVIHPIFIRHKQAMRGMMAPEENNYDLPH